ncbi:MAG: InlB B-repeat-containing protein [Clostridia bacterium]|nr:InlB B-repeat-containing protein [Clostridia bacterium]
MKKIGRLLSIFLSLVMLMGMTTVFSLNSSALPAACPKCGCTTWEVVSQMYHPTCTANGLGFYQCTANKHIYDSQEVIPAYGHTYGRYYINGSHLSQYCGVCKEAIGNSDLNIDTWNTGDRFKLITGAYNAYSASGYPGASYSTNNNLWQLIGDAPYTNYPNDTLYTKAATVGGALVFISKGATSDMYHYTSDYRSKYCMPNAILASQLKNSNILGAGINFKVDGATSPKMAGSVPTGWTFNNITGITGGSNVVSYAYTYNPITERPSATISDPSADGIKQASTEGMMKSVLDAGGGLLVNFIGNTIRSTYTTKMVCYMIMPTVASGSAPDWAGHGSGGSVANEAATDINEVYTYTFDLNGQNFRYDMTRPIDISFKKFDGIVRMVINNNIIALSNGNTSTQRIEYTNASGRRVYCQRTLASVGASMVLNFFEGTGGYSSLCVNGCNYYDPNGAEAAYFGDFTVYSVDGTEANSPSRMAHVRFELNGGTSNNAGERTVAPGTEIILPQASKNNYTFGGWSDGTNIYPAGSAYTVNDSVTFTAVWRDQVYCTVRFDTAGGENISPIITLEGLSIVLPTPVKAGAEFTGWSDGVNIYPAGSTYIVNGGITLTAIWGTPAAATYTVSFNTDGGSACASQTVEAGTQIRLPSTSRSGYIFGGWSDGTSTYSANAKYTVNSNVTFTALWSKEPETEFVTVNFVTNAGYSIVPMQVEKGRIITLPGITRDGYFFVGWNDGNAVYPAGTSYAVNSDVTLSAVWSTGEPGPVGDIGLEKVGGYDVKLTNLDPNSTYVVRYATGEYASAGAIKKGTNAGFTQISGKSEAMISLPTHGVHTVSAQVGSEQRFIGTVTVSQADIEGQFRASSRDLAVKVENLNGASRVNVMQNGNILMKINASSFTTDGLKTWTEFNAPAPGEYAIRIFYTDGGSAEGTVNVTVPETEASTNGRIFTLSGYGANNVSYIRFAKGVITTAAEMKSASDLRTFGAKYFKSETAAFAALDAVNGETTTYTVQVGYVSGYSEFVTFDITPTVPTIQTAVGTIVLKNVQTAAYELDWVRCAPGTLGSLYAIRHANGSQVRRTSDIVNNRITFSGLSAGAYTLYYLYDGWNLSEGLVTVTVN